MRGATHAGGGRTCPPNNNKIGRLGPGLGSALSRTTLTVRVRGRETQDARRPLPSPPPPGAAVPVFAPLREKRTRRPYASLPGGRGPAGRSDGVLRHCTVARGRVALRFPGRPGLPVYPGSPFAVETRVCVCLCVAGGDAPWSLSAALRCHSLPPPGRFPAGRFPPRGIEFSSFDSDAALGRKPESGSLSSLGPVARDGGGVGFADWVGVCRLAGGVVRAMDARCSMLAQARVTRCWGGGMGELHGGGPIRLVGRWATVGARDGKKDAIGGMDRLLLGLERVSADPFSCSHCRLQRLKASSDSQRTRGVGRECERQTLPPVVLPGNLRGPAIKLR